MSRAKLKNGQQRQFLNRIAKYFYFNWAKIAKVSSVCNRTLRDWRREKYKMNYEALLRLHRISKIPIPKDIKILPEHWSIKKASRLGAIIHNKLYGNPGTLEGRRKGGRNSQKLFRSNPEYARKAGVIVRKIIKEPAHSEELAEFIGIMLGDGGISNYQINITLNNETDREYSVYVQELIKKLFSISVFVLSRRLEKTDRIVASGRSLVEFLKRKGLIVGNKVRSQIDIPAWILNNRKYAIACLRGLIDTDGSFYSYEHTVFKKKYYNFAMCFTNHSMPLIKKVSRILNKLGLSPIMNTKRVYLHRAKDIDKYFSEVGTHNPKYLQRYKNFISLKGY